MRSVVAQLILIYTQFEGTVDLIVRFLRDLFNLAMMITTGGPLCPRQKILKSFEK